MRTELLPTSMAAYRDTLHVSQPFSLVGPGFQPAAGLRPGAPPNPWVPEAGRSPGSGLSAQPHSIIGLGRPCPMPLLVPNRSKGKLIVVEGIDGSGKSTQLALLSQWVRSQEIAVAFSEWNSSPLVRETTRRAKKKNMFTPATFSLIHATDFADRLERYIIPLLKAGAVVCADRYAYTAFARDVVRGVSLRWVRNLYRFAVRPNLAFYFRVPLEVAIGRILGGRNAIKYYEAGMDLGLSRNVQESFRLFQGRILDEYEAMIQEVGFHVIDATGSIEDQQRQMRDIVTQELGESLRNGILKASRGDLDAAKAAARIL